MESPHLGRGSFWLSDRLVCHLTDVADNSHFVLILTSFTLRYNLFSTNVILASIAFVYWPSHGSRWQGLLINFFTLLGSVIGQLLFGFLADFYGRTRLYGIELVLVIVSTIGVATSSYGFDDMSFLGLFIWVRFSSRFFPSVSID